MFLCASMCSCATPAERGYSIDKGSIIIEPLSVHSPVPSKKVFVHIPYDDLYISESRRTIIENPERVIIIPLPNQEQDIRKLWMGIDSSMICESGVVHFFEVPPHTPPVPKVLQRRLDESRTPHKFLAASWPYWRVSESTSDVQTVAYVQTVERLSRRENHIYVSPPHAVLVIETTCPHPFFSTALVHVWLPEVQRLESLVLNAVLVKRVFADMAQAVLLYPMEIIKSEVHVVPKIP